MGPLDGVVGDGGGGGGAVSWRRISSCSPRSSGDGSIPQLVAEPGLHLQEGGQCLGPSACGDQGAHQLPVGPLVERRRLHDPGQGPDGLVVPAELEQRLDPVCRSGLSLLVEVAGRGRQRGVGGQVAERPAVPAGLRLVQQGERLPWVAAALRLLDQVPEQVRVELMDGEVHAVAVGCALNGWWCVGRQRQQLVAQPGDVALQRLAGGVRGSRSPQRVDEPVGGDDLAIAREQQCQDGPLLPTRKHELASARDGAHRAQHQEPHHRHPTGGKGPVCRTSRGSR